MSIRMIALDMDGTTLNSKGVMSEYTQNVLCEATNSGIYMVVATGRTYNSRPDIVDKLGFIDYLLTSNGAVAYDLKKNQIVYEKYLTAANVRRTVEFCAAENLGIEVFVKGQAYISQSAYDMLKDGKNELNRNAPYVLKTRIPLKNLTEFVYENDTKVENINVILTDIKQKEYVYETLNQFPDATVTSSFKGNVEIGGSGASKAEALRQLLSITGLNRSQLMCFGDASNDISMIEYAGIGVAVGNAWQGVKDAADLVADTNDNDGVAKMIERIVFER